MNNYLEFMLYESDVDPSGLPDRVIFLEGKNLSLLAKKEKRLINLFENKGFNRVIPPTFKYYETYEKVGGPEVARRSFSM